MEDKDDPSKKVMENGQQGEKKADEPKKDFRDLFDSDGKPLENSYSK